MRLQTLRIKNFKALRDVEMTDIPPFCVIVGANGSGKSTLFNVFAFLKDALTYNVTRALEDRGGFREVVSRGSESEPIEIEMQLKLEITGKERLVTYHLEIGQESGRPVVLREILRYKRGESGAPFHFLDFGRGTGVAVSNEEDFSKTDAELKREMQTLDSPDILAIKGLGQFQRFKAASAFRQMLENWRISDLHVEAARIGQASGGEYNHLSRNGDNLQRVAKHIHQYHPEVFSKIVERMSVRVPGIKSITPIEAPDGRLILQFEDGSLKTPFIDKYVSDGTLRMFAYLMLLYDPQPFPLLCVEEPENQLYPELLYELAEEFRDYARRGDGQVFVSTHSPDFLNATELDEVYWLVKEGGYTNIVRASEDEQVATYMRDGDKMGYLWKQGFFHGVHPR